MPRSIFPPTDPERLFNAAHAALRMGDGKKARYFVELAAKISPSVDVEREMAGLKTFINLSDVIIVTMGGKEKN